MESELVTSFASVGVKASQTAIIAQLTCRLRVIKVAVDAIAIRQRRSVAVVAGRAGSAFVGGIGASQAFV